MAPGQACKKASAMQHAARNGGSERQLPSTQPTRTKYVGALEHKARPVQCGNHQTYAFYFPPSRDTSKKNRGKGQEKGKPSWTNPGSAAETPREEESHTANHHDRVVGGSIKKLAFGGSSDTVPHMERNRFPVGGDGRRRRMGRRRRQGIRTNNKRKFTRTRQAILRGEIYER